MSKPSSAANQNYFPMRSTFGDTNIKWGYDKKIEDTRKVLSKNTSPCVSYVEISRLVAYLKSQSVFFNEIGVDDPLGFSLSNLNTHQAHTHKKRVDQRIETFIKEVYSTHIPNCYEYMNNHHARNPIKE